MFMHGTFQPVNDITRLVVPCRALKHRDKQARLSRQGHALFGGGVRACLIGWLKL